MKLIRAARFTALAFLVVGVYTFAFLSPGLSIAREWSVRQAWLAHNQAIWTLGGWLWMLAIFAWMVLIITTMYTYTPAHRVTTSLQSGLMHIGGALLVGGVVIWMAVLPRVATAEMAALTDGISLSLLGGGLFLGALVTGWVAIDLIQLGKLPWVYLAPGILVGVFVLPTPLLLPHTTLLLAGLVCLIAWSAFLGTRRKLPSAYPEL
jgi:hypothetical protein